MAVSKEIKNKWGKKKQITDSQSPFEKNTHAGLPSNYGK